jgi:hypothetical protein
MAKFTAMIEWQVQATWFELDSRTRLDFTRQMQEIISGYPTVRFRWFDAEAWTGKFTDFSLCEFDELDVYNSLWGELRRHPFLATPYAYASRVLMGMEVLAPDPVVPPANCLACGHPLKPTGKFCGGCGASTQA